MCVTIKIGLMWSLRLLHKQCINPFTLILIHKCICIDMKLYFTTVLKDMRLSVMKTIYIKYVKINTYKCIIYIYCLTAINYSLESSLYYCLWIFFFYFQVNFTSAWILDNILFFAMCKMSTRRSAPMFTSLIYSGRKLHLVGALKRSIWISL